MPEPELKPCPRCGGEAMILAAPPTSHMGDESYAVECKACCLLGPYSPNQTMAAAWWNERPAEQAKVVYSIGVERDYDPGLLNDYGGGNVQWWQDYIRAEVERCNGYWRSVFAAAEQANLTPGGYTPEQVASLVEKVREAWTPEQAKDERTWTCGKCNLVFHGDCPTGWNGYCSSCQPVIEQAAPEPTHAAEDRPPKQHECPYGSMYATCPATGDWQDVPCGTNGQLCDRCQQDRADARARMDQAPLGDRVAWVEDHLAALETRAFDDMSAQVVVLSQTLAETQMRIARMESLLLAAGITSSTNPCACGAHDISVDEYAKNVSQTQASS